MTEHPTATVARDLSEIMKLAADLPEQAEHQANSRVMMGGDALANLAPVANLEAWAYRHAAAEDAAERGERAWPSLEHEDDGDEPVLQSLLFWTEDLRRQMDAEWGTRPTIVSEASFLRFNIERVYDSEPRFDDLADDVSKARRKLENVLRAGKRDEATRVRCVREICQVKPPLRQIVTDEGLQEKWKCRACRGTYNRIDFEDARRKQWLNAGDHFVPAVEAESLLLSMRVPPSNVRKWLDAEGLSDEDVRYDGRTRMVRWSAVYTKQRAEKTERKGA